MERLGLSEWYWLGAYEKIGRLVGRRLGCRVLDGEELFGEFGSAVGTTEGYSDLDGNLLGRRDDVVRTKLSLVLGFDDWNNEGCSDLDGKKLGSKISCVIAGDGAIEAWVVGSKTPRISPSALSSVALKIVVSTTLALSPFPLCARDGNSVAIRDPSSEMNSS
jgi:hypothetical protein